MIVAILILVVFLATMQVISLFGFTNTRARNEAARRIALELYELQQTERREA